MVAKMAADYIEPDFVPGGSAFDSFGWSVPCSRAFSCSSNVILTGVNGNVIMSGWKDDNPDDER